MAASSGTHTKSRGTFKLPFYETRRQPGLAPESALVTGSSYLRENSLSDCGVLGVLDCLHSSFSFCCVRGPFPESFLIEWTSKAKRHDRATGLHTSDNPRVFGLYTSCMKVTAFDSTRCAPRLRENLVTFEGRDGRRVHGSEYCGTKSSRQNICY